MMMDLIGVIGEILFYGLGGICAVVFVYAVVYAIVIAIRENAYANAHKQYNNPPKDHWNPYGKYK